MAEFASPQRTCGIFEDHQSPTPREIDDLKRQGVSEDVLCIVPPVRAGYVVFDQAGFEFEVHTSGAQPSQRTFLFLVTDPHGIARDVVAWCPRQNKIATWLNRAFALGEEAIFAPRRSSHDELPVWRSPLDWLRARRSGIVLIRPKAAAHYLAGMGGPLLAEDAMHGAELRQHLTIPAPRILIPTTKQKAA